MCHAWCSDFRAAAVGMIWFELNIATKELVCLLCHYTSITITTMYLYHLLTGPLSKSLAATAAVVVTWCSPPPSIRLQNRFWWSKTSIQLRKLGDQSNGGLNVLQSHTKCSLTINFHNGCWATLPTNLKGTFFYFFFFFVIGAVFDDDPTYWRQMKMHFTFSIEKMGCKCGVLLSLSLSHAHGLCDFFAFDSFQSLISCVLNFILALAEWEKILSSRQHLHCSNYSWSVWVMSKPTKWFGIDLKTRTHTCQNIIQPISIDLHQSRSHHLPR